MRSTIAEHSCEQAGRTIVLFFDCTLIGQRIQFGKDISGTLIALDEKGIQPHNCRARTYNDDDYGGLRHLKSTGLQEAARFVAENIQRLVLSILYDTCSNRSHGKSPKANFRFFYGYQKLLLLALNELPKRRCYRPIAW